MRQLKITKSITNRESASLDKYLQEIGKEELITVEEEVELAQRIKKGDQEALEKLTKANLRQKILPNWQLYSMLACPGWLSRRNIKRNRPHRKTSGEKIETILKCFAAVG